MIDKIQEACEIAKEIGKDMTFETIGSMESGLTIYMVDELGKIEIGIEDFMREYRKLKRDEESANLKKIGKQSMDILCETSKVDATIPVVTCFKEPKSERQRKILEVLSQTKQLTENLEHQLKALDEKGVLGERGKK